MPAKKTARRIPGVISRNDAMVDRWQRHTGQEACRA